jgi:hypothetical protein
MKRLRETELEPPRPGLRLEIGTDLTWDHVDYLTERQIGVFTLPCPYCGHDKPWSQRFRLERHSLGSAKWHCFYCGESGSLRRDGPADPQEEAAARKAAKEKLRAEQAAKSARALQLWNDAKPVTGTPVIDYLRARAIRDLPPNVHDVLRYHPACPFGREGVRQCMLALFRDVRSDQPRAIHRTWLGSGGKALGRMALGPIANAAIKLWPADGDSLVVGEGIETTLAAALHLTRANGKPLRPAWALSVANNLKYLPIITGIKQLVILVDNDLSGVGQQVAEVCSRRWRDGGVEVVKLLPTKPGTDFNDLVR